MTRPGRVRAFVRSSPNLGRPSGTNHMLSAMPITFLFMLLVEPCTVETRLPARCFGWLTYVEMFTEILSFIREMFQDWYQGRDLGICSN